MILYISNPEIKFLIQELIKLKKQIITLNDIVTPTWQKNLIAFTPLISAILTGAIGLLITWKLFEWNKEKEKANRVADDLNKSKETNRKLFGEAFYLVESIHNQIIGLNLTNLDILKHTAIYAKYVTLGSSHNVKVLEHVNTLRTQFSEYQKTVIENKSKLAALIGEIFFLTENDGSRLLFLEITTKDILMEIDAEIFNHNLELIELTNIKNTQVDLFTKGIGTNFKSDFDKLVTQLNVDLQV
jgi:hypothetical protein